MYVELTFFWNLLQPPTPETDYPSLSPDELDRYPEEDYSPVGSYHKQLTYPCVPSAYQSWGSYGYHEGQLFDGDHYVSDTVRRGCGSLSQVRGKEE